MVQNLFRILGVELLCAAQGVEFRAPLRTSDALQHVLVTLRKRVPPLDRDRFLAPDLEAAATLVANAHVIEAADMAMPHLAP